MDVLRTNINEAHPFLQGVFIKESNRRFLAEVELNGKTELCYMPTSCKLSPFINLSGRETLMLPIKKKNSRTKYAVYAVKNGKDYILINLAQCNRIVENEIHRRYFSFLGKRKNLSRETCIGGYKTDLFIEDTNTIIEIKSILSKNSQAMFPAVHSERALIQLKKLSMLLEKGYSVCYIFVSVNPKTRQLMLDETDTEYCKLFRACLMKGMYCCGFSVTLQDGMAKVKSRLKVEMEDEQTRDI